MQLDKFKIKELMAKQGINTQSELAQMLGISKNQLSNILSNRFNPIKSNVVELADFFGVNPLVLIKKGDIK
ncbi:hypothetical protein SPONL_1534 [uncultured Candidatus Thioglobus sp.]|nr:hypothetical protein SPONL_1534 [uncultured Candidatus Thioglobus sp.]